MSRPYLRAGNTFYNDLECWLSYLEKLTFRETCERVRILWQLVGLLIKVFSCHVRMHLTRNQAARRIRFNHFVGSLNLLTAQIQVSLS